MPEPGPCPLCGQETLLWERYPGLICERCSSRAVDEDGRPMRFFNLSSLGSGFRAEVWDGELWNQVASGRCFVDGRECIASEHRFGGIVVQLVA